MRTTRALSRSTTSTCRASLFQRAAIVRVIRGDADVRGASHVDETRDHVRRQQAQVGR
jgi:hypothetical protein